jgi:hypothetical protein
MDDKRYEINFLKGETFSYSIYNNNILSDIPYNIIPR